jgi:hypothetical protein
MTTSALIMTWGMPIEGRESKALEVFFATVQYWNRLQQEKKIEVFHSYGTITGNLETQSGMLIAEGSDAQIEAVRNSEEFRQVLARVTAIGHNIGVELAETGERMTTRMQRYGQAVKQTLGSQGVQK